MEKEGIWIDGPPTGIDLKETRRHYMSPPDDSVIVVTYQRVDLPLAIYYKIIKPDGSEKWAKVRPQKAFRPVANPPDVTKLKELDRYHWDLPQGRRTVISYVDIGSSFVHWYHRTLNPEGDEWTELRHPADDELARS